MSAPPLSKRGADAPASPIRKLAPYAVNAKRRGIVVHHLNIGQPDIPTPQGMLDAYRNFDAKVIAYSPSEGLAEYRQALVEYYRPLSGTAEEVGADDIVVTVGGSEALVFAIASVTDPGDNILVCEPYYTNYAGFSHLLGTKVRPVTTRAHEDFRVDVSKVAATIDDRTRAVVIPTPGNPTGVVLSAEELEELAALCKKRGIFLISDEVYREFVYDLPEGSVAPSVLSIKGAEDITLVIDSVSKRYSACGSRVGCLVTRNKKLRAAALCFAQARLSPATVDQHAAMAALDTPPSYFREVVEEYRGRRDVLVEGLRAIGVRCTTPKGAFYLVAPLPVADAEDFCRFLLDDFQHDGQTVMLAPASGFYATPGLGKNEVRIAYVLDRQRLSKSVQIIGEALKQYPTT